MRRPARWRVTVAGVLKAALPVAYTGASLRVLAALRDRRDPAVRDIATALASAAIALSTLPPGSLAACQRVLGDANYARLLSQLGTVAAAGSGNSVLQRSSRSTAESAPRVRRHRRQMLATAAAMTTLFARDRSIAAELQQPTERLTRPLSAAYWLLFSAFMVRSTTETGRLALRTSRLTHDPGLRHGLRCVTIGGLGLSGFYGHYALAILGKLLNPRLPGPVRGVRAQAVIATCAATIAVGASLPGAAWRVRTWARTAADARMAAGLRPLWRPLRTALPDLGVPVSPWQPELRLQRRVIEVLDGLDALVHRQDPAGTLYRQACAVGRARRLSDDQITALYRAALLRYDHTWPAPAEPARHPTDGRTPPLTGGAVDRDWRTEARRLLHTAALLRHSPLPAEVAALTRTALTPDPRSPAA